ncbi:CPBP family glutamic-type intramembrane protease [Senegalia sp. (in: firmicutes)]|uniref:CPBP family glutamic-type intramembrane protease n=2 Tax=Senegalia sp. (in: firmicutes) TaxID=1924098 RepID=UPI003F99E588
MIKRILLFLLFTFSITWLSWGMIVIGNEYFNVLWYGEVLFWAPYLLGALGPMIAFYIIHKIYPYEFQFTSFNRFVFNKNINKKVGIIFFLYLLWRFLMVWFGFGIEEPVSILYMFINLPLMIIGGGFEEIGWRGYLQPNLEKIFTYIPATIVVGVIWALWHLPLWFIKGTVQSEINFGIYTLMTIILSFSFSTLYKYSENITLCVLAHAWYNGCIGLAVYIGYNGYLQLDIGFKVFLVYIIEFIVSVILGVIYNRKMNSTRIRVTY